MPNRLVIVNTSPLLYLHQTDCLYLLQQLYKRVTAPGADIARRFVAQVSNLGLCI